MANLQRKALVSGITGQDGYYLAEWLMKLGYSVHGMLRISSFENTAKLKELWSNMGSLTLHYGDLTDSHSIKTLMEKVKPDEIYNLGAQSHVGKSFTCPEQTGEATGLGVLRVLEAARQVVPHARFYQASTSELYGKAAETPQNEDTLFAPRSPYAIAKLYGYWMVRMYRDAYGMHASNGILFNHESPHRGEHFVTRKIVKQMVEVVRRERTHIELGNLDAKRDWGYAGDYVKAMHRILQQNEPGDYVIATGETHTVREFVEETARALGFEMAWEGEGVDQIGKNANTGEVVVKINPEFYRPAEVDILMGDASKAKEVLGWEPEHKFADLIKLMVEAECSGKEADDL